MSSSTKRTFLFKTSISFISSSVRKKSKIWNNRNKRPFWRYKLDQAWDEGRSQQWEPFKELWTSAKIYDHPCGLWAQEGGIGLVLDCHLTRVELEFCPALCLWDNPAGTPCQEFQMLETMNFQDISWNFISFYFWINCWTFDSGLRPIHLKIYNP